MGQDDMAAWNRAKEEAYKQASTVPNGINAEAIEWQKHNAKQVERAMPVVRHPELEGPFFVPVLAAVVFRVTSRSMFNILASVERKSDGHPWYHVSMSNRDGPGGLPGYDDICFVREVMFRRGSVVVQVFPPASEHVNISEVLHLWERLGGDRLIPDLRQVELGTNPYTGKSII